MRPIPITDEWQSTYLPEGRRTVVGPPDNDPTGEIRPVEMVCTDGWASCAFALEGDDLARLDAGGRVLLTLWGGYVQPFACQVVDGEPGTYPAEGRLAELDQATELLADMVKALDGFVTAMKSRDATCMEAAFTPLVDAHNAARAWGQSILDRRSA